MKSADEIMDILKTPRDVFTVKRVFGDPIEKDGVMVIPVAYVAGGAGGGGGSGSQPGTEEKAEGFGGGWGGAATPAGVYVIKDGEVSWRPALSWTGTALKGLGVLALMVRAWASISKSRARKKG